MARVLTFCRNTAAVKKHGEQGALMITGDMSYRHRYELLAIFKSSADVHLAVSPGFVHGYHVPEDTQIVFDESWPYGADHPMTRQAEARRFP